MADGGPGIGAELFAKGINAPSQSTEKPKDLSDFLNQLLGQFVLLIGKPLPVNTRSLMENPGALANADITKAGLQINNPIVRPVSAPGGALANIVADGFQIASVKDFSSLKMPEISPLVMNTGVDISPANLGNLSAQTFGDSSSVGRSGGMDFA